MLSHRNNEEHPCPNCDRKMEEYEVSEAYSLDTKDISKKGYECHFCGYDVSPDDVLDYIYVYQNKYTDNY